MAYQPDLKRLLTAGARYHGETADFLIEAHRLADLVTPTGRIVACDPLVYAEQEPFTVAVPPGRYPLVAWVAVLNQGAVETQRRVAALQLVIRPQPATRWEPALVPDQDARKLTGNHYFGYPVDAGVGTFADPTALRALDAWDYDRVEEVYVPAQLPRTPVPGVAGAVTDEETGANVIVVGSGWGDGSYPTFVGYTETGEVASFVTDFMVVPDPG